VGDSAKLPNPGPDTYRFTTSRKYLGWFHRSVVGPSHTITLVVHDWGSALGFDWANHHRDRTAASPHGGDRAAGRLLG